MTIISKVGATLGLVSCITDMHRNALIYSKRNTAKVGSDAFIQNSIGCQKANRLSSKDAERKNWLDTNPLFIGTREFFAGVSGYAKGFCMTGARYLPNFILAGLAIGLKGSVKSNPVAARIANFSAVALGAVEAFDFLKNSTNFNQKTDYLKN